MMLSNVKANEKFILFFLVPNEEEFPAIKLDCFVKTRGTGCHFPSWLGL